MLIKQTILILLALTNSQLLLADEYHYQDLIVGERAAGLAGAYISISDDPSGIYHNPAGIIYNFENYFSLSANVYKTSKVTYKKAVAGQDYTTEASGWVPNFFGATQNYGKMKMGFAILSPSSEVLDLDDKIKGISTTNETQSLRRRLMRQYSISLYGLGLAMEPMKDFAAGVSLFLGQLTDKTMNTQIQIINGSPDKYAITESFNDQSSLFLYPKIGVQWMPAPKWAIGAVAATSTTLYSKQKVRTAGAKFDDTGHLPGGSNNDVTYLDSSEANYKPNVLSPYEFGLGTSYFPSKELLFSFDFKYYSDDPSFKGFVTAPVMNFALGTEWFASERVVLRGGFYTNNANTPALVNNRKNQSPHVDYYGLTAGITFESPGSSFTFCTQYSKGSGKGQVVGNSTAQQDIDATATAIYITASYQM